MPDYALVGDELTGKVVVHRADCASARLAAMLGMMVVTMFDSLPLPDDFDADRHTCLLPPAGESQPD